MPRKSKVSVPGATKTKATRPEIELKIEKMPEDKIKCSMCGRVLRTKGNASSYYKSNSIIHKGNGGYIPVCKSCLEDLFSAYKNALGSTQKAIQRICMKFDVYWNERIYESILEKRDTRGGMFKIGEYLKTVNLYQYRGSTYDTTLDEEASRIQTQIDLVIAGEEMTEDIDVSPEQIRTWGSGFDPLFYRELDQRYDYWTEDLDFDKVDKATETLIRQICIQEVILSRDAAAGRPIDKTAKMIDSLLGSLNLKPVQKPQKTVVEDAMDEETEMTPFGVWIRKIEDDRPIPEAEEQFADVDHLKDYLQTWFVGGLCNMMHIPNAFSDKFEEAMQKYTVEKPEYHADDDDISLDDIFEKAEEEGRKVRSNGGTSGPSDEDEDY